VYSWNAGNIAHSVEDRILKAFLTFLSVGAAAVAVASEPTSALDYRYHVYEKQIVINASGDIELDEATTFSRWVKNFAPRWGGRKATTIVFDSPGGNPFGAFDLSHVIARYRLTTGVAAGGMCASSCVLAWASGTAKFAASDSAIGVHRPTLDGLDLTNPTVALWATKVAMAYANGLKDRGAPISVMNALSTPANEVHWLTPDELAAWNVHMTH
jgi:hypothetical protein